ncbi:hypothetical protein [Ferrimonas lipolytica]|uniref:Uncharacterized protein n=1 Tax=Ferrimonas lipolytica TaxID=2724191 RepID=A0A6H1UFS8_9GAMM|nr:hypothetical protein [Ferrimonas lipolytica]QIZ77479.1 hypothetical protein HER31_11625 [Ferrimonas lipolytica]
MKGAEIIPAPWNLSGTGIILLYHFKADWLRQHRLVPTSMRDHCCGGLGALMLVNYLNSDCGVKPYQEMLFIPGKFHWPAQPASIKRHSITDIVVSTEQSAISGNANWAIPKRLAQFAWQQHERNSHICVTEQQQPLVDISLSHYPIPLPMHTALLPMPLAQPHASQLWLTDYVGRGFAYPAKVNHFHAHSTQLAPLNNLNCIAALYVSPFRLEFPTVKKVAIQ